MSKKQRRRNEQAAGGRLPAKGAPAAQRGNVSDAGRQRRTALGVGLSSLALVLIAFFYLRSHPVAPSGSAPSPSAAISFSGTHYASQGHQGHIPGDAQRYANFRYNSDPPTSGYHREIFTPSFVNVTPIPAYVQVHLLEHGNILLQYNCMCPELARQLEKIASQFDTRLLPAGTVQPTKSDVQNAEEQGLAVIVAPNPNVKQTIALTAWTRLAGLDSLDQAKIISFINQWLHDPDNLKQ